jgi:hypothetical protein
MEFFSDLPSVQTLADVLEYLQFSIRQAIDGGLIQIGGDAANCALEDAAIHGLAKVHVVLGHRRKGGQDLVTRVVLMEESQRTGPQSALRVDRFIARRQDEYSDAGIPGEDTIDHRNAGTVVHANSDNNDIWLGGRQELDSFSDVSSLTANFKVRLGGKDCSQSFADKLTFIKE